MKRSDLEVSVDNEAVSILDYAHNIVLQAESEAELQQQTYCLSGVVNGRCK